MGLLWVQDSLGACGESDLYQKLEGVCSEKPFLLHGELTRKSELGSNRPLVTGVSVECSPWLFTPPSSPADPLLLAGLGLLANPGKGWI